MQGLKEMLVEEQKYLEKIADAARKSLLIVPEGRLRISKSKYNPRYYQCMEGGNEIYISRTEKELPKQLAQKDYNKAVEKSLDSYKFNLLHCKQTFISQLKSGALGARTCAPSSSPARSGTCAPGA